MATVGLALAVQPSPPLPVQSDIALGPQANAVPAQNPAHPDVVTLAGRTPENGQTRTGTDNAHFGEAAAFFFAEKQSFRAANGSGGSQTAQAPSVPELPVKLATGSLIQQNAATNTDSAQHQAAPATNAPAQGGADDIAANLETNNGIGAASQAAAGVSDTPLAELAQLDRTLQQIGIDPQSISLFSRMAMLLYANDPAALKILVQTLQSAAQLATDPNVGTAPTSQAESQTGSVQNLVSAQPQTPNSTPTNQGTSGPDIQANVGAQLTFETQPSLPPEAQQNQGTTAPNNAQSPGTVTSNSTVLAPYQSTKVSPQFGDLNLTSAAVGVSQFLSGSQNTQPGQLLNVTF